MLNSALSMNLWSLYKNYNIRVTNYTVRNFFFSFPVRQVPSALLVLALIKSNFVIWKINQSNLNLFHVYFFYFKITEK